MLGQFYVVKINNLTRLVEVRTRQKKKKERANKTDKKNFESLLALYKILDETCKISASFNE